jgi:hypothetical protein
MSDLLPAFQLAALFNSRHFAQVIPDAVHGLAISISVADRVWEYQHTLPHPRYLGDLAFSVAGLARCESSSRHIHDVLVANKIILPAPSPEHPVSQHPHGSTVNAEGITRHFSRNTDVVNTLVRRKVVKFLTFWHKECRRLNEVDELVWEMERRMELRPWEADAREFCEVFRSWRTLKPRLRWENSVGFGRQRRVSRRPLEGVGEEQGAAAAVVRVVPRPARLDTFPRNRTERRGVGSDGTYDEYDDPPPPYSAV